RAARAQIVAGDDKCHPGISQRGERLHEDVDRLARSQLAEEQHQGTSIEPEAVSEAPWLARLVELRTIERIADDANGLRLHPGGLELPPLGIGHGEHT